MGSKWDKIVGTRIWEIKTLDKDSIIRNKEWTHNSQRKTQTWLVHNEINSCVYEFVLFIQKTPEQVDFE